MKNQFLFARVKKLVAAERRIGTAILDCLHEIDLRRAYAELRYDGLFTFCVKELGFTDAQAYQRIQAMRALRENPELKTRIESGALSVSAVSKVQTHLRNEAKLGKKRPAEERFKLFRAMEYRTSREVEAELARDRGEEVKVKLVLEMDPELAELWERVKNLAAHRSGGDAAEVLKILAREWIERNDPAREPGQRSVRRVGTEVKGDSVDDRSHAALRRAVPFPEKSAAPGKVPPKGEHPSRQHPRILPEHRHSPPASLRRKIWRLYGGKCARCESRHALQIDHVIPFAAGGTTTEENLRLLCRSCNLALAGKTFGPREPLFGGYASSTGIPKRSTEAPKSG